MLKKSRVIWLALVLLLGVVPVAHAVLSSVGPINPVSGFPKWYRDTIGQTVELTVPADGLNLPDPPIPGNAFSQTIGFGSEAFYWASGAAMAVPGGSADLVLALEAAFNNATGDAQDGRQMVFARVRIWVDIQTPGTYVVTHPYGSRTFRNVPAGIRAINFTQDIGAVTKQFTRALNGAIGPFLKQGDPAQPPSPTNVAAPAGTLGNHIANSIISGSPTGNNFFRISGPDGTFTQTIFNTGAKLFTGVPFTVPVATFTRDALGAATANITANISNPVPAGVRIRALIPGMTAVLLTRNGNNFVGVIPITAAFNPNITIRGVATGLTVTNEPVTLKDVITISRAEYSVSLQQLRIRAVSTDALANLFASGWQGAPGAGQPINNGRLTRINGVLVGPANISVRSSSGGVATSPVTFVP